MKIGSLFILLFCLVGCKGKGEKDEHYCVKHDVYSMECKYERDWALDKDGLLDSNDKEFRLIEKDITE